MKIMNMKMKTLNIVVLMLLASFNASAAETESACKLRGGSIVPLPAEACANEGGTMVTVTTAPASATTAPAAPVAAPQLSADPAQAAAQKAIIDLLNKPVVDKSVRKGEPEGIDRAAKFAGCKLMVDESMRLDYGNVISQRKEFKLSSTIDFQNIKRDAFGVLGKVASGGGELKAYAVYVEEPKRSANNLSIAVSVLSDDAYKKFTLPGPAAYWEGPRYDLWMADEYGYPKISRTGDVPVATDNLVTDRIRILFIVNTADDAAALKKAFDDMQAACKP